MAEIALSAIPFVTTIFESCVKSFAFFTDIRTFPRDSHSLLWKFRIQETRLKVWGKEWGLLGNTPGGGEPSAIFKDEEDVKYVLETLGRVERLLKDYEKIRSKYGLALVSDEYGNGYPTMIASQFAQNILTPDIEGHLQLETSHLTLRHKENGFFKRVRWVAIDKSRMEMMVQDLKDFNDGLYFHLSATERKTARQALAPDLIKTDDLNEVIHLEEATMGGTVMLHETVRLKKHRLQVTDVAESGIENINLTTRQQIETLKIPLSALSDFRASKASKSGDQERSFATLTKYTYGVNGEYGVPITLNTLVEWRKYSNDMPGAVKEAIRDRITNLACFLNIPNVEGLNVPKCLGYIDDPERARIGLVFDSKWKLYLSKNHVEPPSDFISLQRLISRKSKTYLGDRFRLAFTLASSMSLLHTAGWLHKGFRSDNVLFTTDNITALKEPRLLGFEYARPSSAYAFSSLVTSSNHEENLYRHPRVQGPVRARFSRDDDIYALGIVLMEIGFWRPISELWADRYSPEDFQSILWSNYIPQLGNKVGKIYMDVVERCITGRLGGVSGQMGDIIEHDSFFWNIVRPLATLMA